MSEPPAPTYTKGPYAARATPPAGAKPPGLRSRAPAPVPAPAPRRPVAAKAKRPVVRPPEIKAPAKRAPPKPIQRPKPIARPAARAAADAVRTSPITTRSATTAAPPKTRLGRSITVEPAGGPAVCSILLLHGFACDAAGCAETWKPRLKAMGDLGSRARLVFLHAPRRAISCYPGEAPVENAWHDYFTDHGGVGGRPEIEEDIDQTHLAEVRILIHQAIDAEAAKFGGDYRRVALFGESQGGCTALDAATTHSQTIGGVFCSFGQLYACTPISAKAAKDLKIVLWHGSRDKTIAASLSLRSAARLLDRGAKKLTVHVEDGLEHCQGSDGENRCLRRALENWGFLSGPPETAPEPKASPARLPMASPARLRTPRAAPPPTPPSIIKPPGLKPPPRPPRSERATPDPTPPGFAHVSLEAIGREILAIVEENAGAVKTSQLGGRYRNRYGKILDYRTLGFTKLSQLVSDIPGVAYDPGNGGSISLAAAAAPMYDDEYDDGTDSELEGYA